MATNIYVKKCEKCSTTHPSMKMFPQKNSPKQISQNIYLLNNEFLFVDLASSEQAAD
jgi:hypothetical protein